MKKLIYLFLTVLIVACSGEDSNNSSNNGSNVSIEGRWNYTSYVDDGEQATVVGCELQNYLMLDGGSGTFYYYEEAGAEDDCVLWLTDEVTYEAGGNANIYRFYYPSEGYYLDGELNGNTLTIKYENLGEDFDDIYTRD
jgi:hypothetical protein